MNDRSSTAEVAHPQNEMLNAIVASATERFYRLGFHGASMRDIAAGAGVSVGNIYNYFAAKCDILLEVLRRASAAQMELTQRAISATGADVRDRLAAAVDAYVHFAIDHAPACFVANSELRYLEERQRREIVAERDKQQQVFEDLIAEGLQSGVFRVRDPHEACVAILMMCAGVTLWYRPNGPLGADQIAERYARFALAIVEQP